MKIGAKSVYLSLRRLISFSRHVYRYLPISHRNFKKVVVELTMKPRYLVILNVFKVCLFPVTGKGRNFQGIIDQRLSGILLSGSKFQRYLIMQCTFNNQYFILG